MQESQGEVWGSVLGIPGETVVLGPSSSVTFGCTSLVVVCAHQHTMGGGADVPKPLVPRLQPQIWQCGLTGGSFPGLFPVRVTSG